MSRDLINVGKIVGTHGVRGIMKVEILSDFPQRFKGLKSVKLSHKGTVNNYTIESGSLHKGMFLVKLTGIDSKEEAQNYKGALLVVNEEEAYPLPEGSYYHFQLEGLGVYDLERGYLGQLTAILETGANDVYVIESDQYGEVLIPALKEVILDVDLSEKKMMVKLLKGLIEE